MTNPKLSDEDYDAIVEALVNRAMIGARSIAREAINTYMPKKTLEESKWMSDSKKPVIATIMVGVEQVIGDALLEWEKRRK
jgi:hypothetical protein